MSQDLKKQEEFDKKYITSSEIQKRIGVERSSILNARKVGRLPDWIRVQGLGAYIWEREAVEPYLKAWELIRSTKEVDDAIG